MNTIHINTSRSKVQTNKIALFQEMKISLNQERKQLHKAVEDEHRLIMSDRMRKLVSAKLHENATKDEPEETEESRFFNKDKTLEVVVLTFLSNISHKDHSN